MDQKGRVSIPAAFRRVLEDGDPDWRNRRPATPAMVMVAGMRGEPCISCYTLAEMEALEDRILEVEDYFEREQLLDEITARAQRVQLDDNGRIVLSPRLREEFAIGAEAHFVGKLLKFEIWSPQALAARQGETVQAQRGRPPERDPFRHLARRRPAGGP